jgi:branched-chain amino acid transport system permease protein
VESLSRLFYLSLAVLVVAIVAVRGVRRGRFGRVLVAQRDNEMATSSFGADVVVTKLAAFALSGFVAAVAGSTLVLVQAAFRDEQYDVSSSVGVFIAAVIGGLGSPMGAILGAVYLRGAQWLLPGTWQALASAAGALLVLLAMPDGLAGLWARTRDQLVRVLTRSGT